MKVGLFINTQFPEGYQRRRARAGDGEQVRAARDAGFNSLWFPHHWLTHPMQMLQLTPVMGYLAAHAEGMTIGPNILILPPLEPDACRRGGRDARCADRRQLHPRARPRLPPAGVRRVRHPAQRAGAAVQRERSR